ncbi:MAG: hypothetical protein KME28_13975 [Pelatocladus maniniholoensis HA4357-MV3]|jgi:hypothetical protein|uniref:Uncharacterized protein n=1 Tax=Pelatocladus maniniholoensis HA4357-MV3 TaxID=1117104 RepID=A0A9E3H8S2_9NOST|nr:hypothetical protein [Pelatocladus maniniholoensis HA4357-MV3]BAZ69157.1 hypothetical protein NIES4106_39280 [Fischerella sp. NIES-4106]
MRKSKWLALGVAFAFAGVNFTKLEPVKANPALLAPAAPLCATGVGTVVCAVVGAVTIGGIVYYVVNQGGKKKVIDHQGNTLMNIEDFVVKRDEDDGREYVEVNTIEECKLVKPAIGRDVQNWKLKNGKVRCMLFGVDK